jgi:Fur family peroxide stress response transcriptional regulator
LKQAADNLTGMLLAKGIKPSIQRVKVLEYLMHNRCHPTVDCIYTELRKKISPLSKATVYNAVRVLVEAGLVKAITIEDNEIRYDINTEDHGHFKCKYCGTVYDFEAAMDNYTFDGLDGFQIDDRDIYLKGTCPECLIKQK